MTDTTTPLQGPERSVWPIMVGLGVSLAAFGLLLLVQPMTAAGYATLGAGGAAAAAGVSGWLRRLAREDIASIRSGREEKQPTIGWWGIILFLPSEVILFGSLYAIYFTLRGQALGTGHTFYTLKVMGNRAILNTVFLLSGSALVVVTEQLVRRGKIAISRIFLAAAVVTGALFVMGQGMEYGRLVKDGLLFSGDSYGTSFYLLTGIHGLHVSAGVIVMFYVLTGSLFGQLSRNKHTVLTSVGIYWHFVDAVWLSLLAIVYLRLI